MALILTGTRVLDTYETNLLTTNEPCSHLCHESTICRFPRLPAKLYRAERHCIRVLTRRECEHTAPRAYNSDLPVTTQAVQSMGKIRNRRFE